MGFCCQFEVVVLCLWNKVGKEFDMEKKKQKHLKTKVILVFLIKLEQI